jgi:hypothetical protein
MMCERCNIFVVGLVEENVPLGLAPKRLQLLHRSDSSNFVRNDHTVSQAPLASLITCLTPGRV